MESLDQIFVINLSCSSQMIQVLPMCFICFQPFDLIANLSQKATHHQPVSISMTLQIDHYTTSNYSSQLLQSKDFVTIHTSIILIIHGYNGVSLSCNLILVHEFNDLIHFLLRKNRVINMTNLQSSLKD